MRKYISILLISLFVRSHQACSQISTFDSGFNFIVNVLENDYAGYYDKLRVDKAGYERLKQEILVESKRQPSTDLSNYLLYKKLLVFFNDPHLNLGFNADAIKKNNLFHNVNPQYIRKVQELSSKNLLSFSEKECSKLKGVWGDENEYIITIKQKSSFLFEGIITSGDSTYWFPDQSKFTIMKRKDGQYYSYFLGKDHFLREIKTDILPNEIVFGKFGRIFRNENYFKSISGFQLVQLENNILYLRLPNFLPESTMIVDSIVSANHDKLLNTPYLIVDVRNNPGGSSQSYQSLFPYLVTGPYKVSGSRIRKSERNIASYIQLSNDNRFDSSYKKAFANIADSLRKCMGDFYVLAKDADIVPDTTYMFPRKVIFLANERTGSAAEFLLIRTKGSRKCIVAGQETYGALDYTDANRTFIPAYPYMRINYAVIRSNRIDWPGYERNSGIRPNILLRGGSSEWINSIISLIKSKKI